MTSYPSSSEGTRALSMRALVAEIIGKATLLAKKEVELAKVEVRADFDAEVSTVKGLAVSALVVVLGLNMLLTAAVFVLAAYMPGWLAALLIGGVLVVIGGILGYASWAGRVSRPLAVTRKTLKDNAQWTKERLA
jgi:uncharacterized membrane protein (DUF485 family)